MAKIIEFNNNESLKKELKERISNVTNEYVSVISDIGIKMYGDNYFQVEEYRKLVSDVFSESLCNSLRNISR